MPWKLAQSIAVLLFSVVAHGTQIEVTLHTEAARQTLNALQDPSLTREQALAIAQLHGNQGVIRKENEFGFKATTASFAGALYAAAHDQQVSDPIERSFLFDLVKPKIQQLLALLREIETNQQAFQSAITQRISLFTPSGAAAHFEGYVVAAGDGGGYAFDNTDFFLNIGIVDDLSYAKETMTHELYHAVQNEFNEDRNWTNDAPTPYAKQTCLAMAHLLSDVYNEGSATYVGDISLLSDSHATFAARAREDLKDGLNHIQNSITLLDLSILGFRADPPLPYDDVYDLDFLGHGILYNIGYVIAKAIAEQDGPGGLAGSLKQPTYQFILRYTRLPKYGADASHPKLGTHTIAAAYQLAAGCK